MSDIYTPDVPQSVQYGSPGASPQGDTSKDWMAYAALACGVLSLCNICAFFLPFVCCITGLFSVGAVVFGILGMKTSKRTLAIVGLALGVLGILMVIIASIVALVGGTFFAALEDLPGMLEEFSY